LQQGLLGQKKEQADYRKGEETLLAALLAAADQSYQLQQPQAQRPSREGDLLNCEVVWAPAFDLVIREIVEGGSFEEDKHQAQEKGYLREYEVLHFHQAVGQRGGLALHVGVALAQQSAQLIDFGELFVLVRLPPPFEAGSKKGPVDSLDDRPRKPAQASTPTFLRRNLPRGPFAFGALYLAG